MNGENNTIDPIPDEFATIAEAADFWDDHDFSDYWDETIDVEIEVQAPRRQWVALATHLAAQTAEHARQEGVSVETLVNLWIAERLTAQEK